MTPKFFKPEPSLLPVDEEGKLIVNLFQVKSDRPDIRGHRDAFEPKPQPPLPLDEELRRCRKILDHIQETSQSNSLSVVSFREGWKHMLDDLEDVGRDRTLVVLGGPSGGQNFVYVFSHGTHYAQPKYSLSSDDISHGVSSGNGMVFFTSPGTDGTPVRWAVLNCHDYTNPDLLCALLEQEVEVLVVVTDNAATQLFWEYAISDSHRLFCYIVIVNTAELGGSAVHAPFRKLGKEAVPGEPVLPDKAERDRNAKYGADTVLFNTRGPGEVTTSVPLGIRQLRDLRSEFGTKGFAMLKAADPAARPEDEPVVPPQNYMDTIENRPGPPRPLWRELDTTWCKDKARIAILQLDPLPNEAYTETKYRIAGYKSYKEFAALLLEQLSLVKVQCRARAIGDRHLDLLLLPEVFASRKLETELQEFSNDMKATVVVGVDYPGTEERDNANECWILRPDLPRETYRKITRSQYDAMRNGKLENPPAGEDANRMHMERGTHLLRFIDQRTNRGFGVLICYDFSHLDLIRRLNLEERDEALELLVVVANNPYGNMYKSSCIADSHRFYQYVAMCNVSTYGGSGVFAPIRTKGSRQTLAEMGKGAQGAMIVDLELKKLLDARRKTDAELHTGDFMRRPGVFQRSRT